MAQGTEQVDLKLPSGETVTAVVPSGSSDDQIKGLLRQKHPEYFASQPAAGKAPSGAVQGAPSATAAQTANPLSEPSFTEKIGYGMGLGPDQIAQVADVWRRFSGRAGLPQTLASDQGLGADIKQGTKNIFAPEASQEHPGFGQTLPLVGTAFRQQRETFDQPGMGKVYGSIPFVGPQGYQMGKDIQSKNYAGAAGDAANILFQFLGGKMAPEAAAGIPETAQSAINTVRELRPGLDQASHTILGDAATNVKRTVGQGGAIHQAISEHFGRLTNDIVAADYASGKKIPISDIWEEAMKHADDYAAGKTTPKFNAIVDEIQKRPVELTWKELHDLQQNVDKVTSTAAEGSRDAGAANQMRAAIAKKLDAKAGEVGRGEQWDAAKTIWRTMKEYQGDGVLKKLLNTGTDPAVAGGVAEGGKQFFDVLRDPATQAKLKEINQNLKPYGLPDNYFTNVAKNHAPLHDYLKVQEGSMSRLQLLRAHPVAALPGIILGGAVGAASHVPAAPYIGATLGAAAGVKGAAKLRAAAAMERLGGRPETVSPMAEAAKVEPIGTGAKPVAPAAAVGAVNIEELTDALKSLGYKKVDAANLARQGMAEFPNDFDKALTRAMQGPGKAAKTADLQKIKEK